SRREHVAILATDGSNRAFNENAANRIWALMFGRGIIHPLDMIHADNLPASAGLLEQVTELFVQSQFDIRLMLREIALSRTYQRPFDLPSIDAPATPAETVPAAVKLAATPVETAELAALEAANAWSAATDRFTTAETAYVPVAVEFETALTACTTAVRQLQEATTAHIKSDGALSEKTAQHQTISDALSSLNSAVALIGSTADSDAAVQLLTARQQALAAELPALQKSVDDTKAALAAPTEAVASTRTSLRAAYEKLAPLRESLLALEEAQVGQRREMQILQRRALALKSRLAATQQVLLTSELKRSVEAEQQTAAASGEKQATAALAVDEYVPVVARQTARVQVAQEQMQAAQNDMQQKAQEVVALMSPAAALKEATAAIAAAASAMPDDTGITNLQQRVTAASSTVQQNLHQAEQEKSSAEQILNEMSETMAEVSAELQDMNQELRQRRQLAEAASMAATRSRQQLSELQAKYAESTTNTAVSLADQFALAGLKPLTPEQLCWSIFRVTGVYDRYRAAEIAELEKTAPLTDEQRNDPAFLVNRDVEIEQRTYDKLKGNLGTFVQFYGGGPGQPQSDFFASADQALFTSNGGSINSWVAPPADNPTDRMIRATDEKTAAEELYLGILTRLPTEEETADVVAALAGERERPVVCQELVWALMNSA
ncbi:MAG: DUF1553 domain-containing protein, partial [Planctomycetaceae bacterium]|nr:DUF1553 domain-containing protein [Planctomycetaceae bacterium]